VANPVRRLVHPTFIMRFGFSMPSVRWLLLLLVSLPGVGARADVTLLLEDPINFLGHVTSTGHAALWVEDLCSDDHIHMRWCRADENGSVVSRYKKVNGYDWLAMPPGPYMFGVDSADEIPDTVSAAEVERLRADYRAKNGDSFEKDPPEYGWVQLLGASYRRRVILIRMHTTEDQDLRLMQWLNGRSNRTHFNFFFSNCSDFARQMLDVLFPGSIHRNLFFDVGMTTPKQLESALHHYAKRHPELEFEVHVLPQVPGEIPRSGHLYGVTESFVKSKPYLLLFAVIEPVGIGTVAVAGFADHRYVGGTEERIADRFFFPSETGVATASIAAEP
jgi:hypothetical protein